MASFIVFGCWNRNEKECSLLNPQTPVALVIQSLVELEKKNPCDFYLILGDNQYPEKEEKSDKTEKDKKTEKTDKKDKKDKTKKAKTYNVFNMLSGFRCLSHLQSYKYILFGNHDTDNPSLKLYIDDHPEECMILKNQIKFMNENVQFQFPGKKLTMTRVIGEDVLIMLDSTIYTDIEYECYKVLYPDITGSIQEALMAKQKQEVVDFFFNRTFRNIIVAMHHPVITVKKEAHEIYHPEMYRLLFLLDSFRIKKDPLTVFSADYHIYLEANIVLEAEDRKLKIKQYIAGTGGAKLDAYHKDFDTEVKGSIPGFSFRYNAVKKQEVSHGYLHCQLNDELTAQFVPIKT